MNTCYRCGDEYIPYVGKSNRYGVMANGIIFGVGYKREDGRRVFRRKDKYIPLCENCMKELEHFVEMFNDNKKEVRKRERRERIFYGQRIHGVDSKHE